MAAPALEKPCRMDLRLTSSQRANYEEAAALRGQTLTQWSTSKLDEAAAADIEAARLTRLTGPAFEECIWSSKSFRNGKRSFPIW